MNFYPDASASIGTVNGDLAIRSVSGEMEVYTANTTTITGGNVTFINGEEAKIYNSEAVIYNTHTAIASSSNLTIMGDVDFHEEVNDPTITAGHVTFGSASGTTIQGGNVTFDGGVLLDAPMIYGGNVTFENSSLATITGGDVTLHATQNVTITDGNISINLNSLEDEVNATNLALDDLNRTLDDLNTTLDSVIDAQDLMNSTLYSAIKEHESYDSAQTILKYLCGTDRDSELTIDVCTRATMVTRRTGVPGDVVLIVGAVSGVSVLLFLLASVFVVATRLVRPTHRRVPTKETMPPSVIEIVRNPVSTNVPPRRMPKSRAQIGT